MKMKIKLRICDLSMDVKITYQGGVEFEKPHMLQVHLLPPSIQDTEGFTYPPHRSHLQKQREKERRRKEEREGEREREEQIYIYMCIYIEREREGKRKKKRDREKREQV